MKTKGTPKKIYIPINLSWDRIDNIFYPTRQHDKDIEYILTDAFIDKAIDWLNEHTNLSEKLIIEDFKKYMKGE